MTDIFTPADDQTMIPENPLEALVGEDKKYKTVEDLARSKFEADRFIKQLTTEAAEMREVIGKSQTMEDIKTQILASINQENTQRQPPETPPEPEKVDSANLENMISQLLMKKEAEKKALSNREKVTKALEDKFGADAQIVLNQKARELNVSLDYLAKIANDSPSAFFKLVGIDSAQPPLATPPAPIGSAGTPPKQMQNTIDWDRMKATNPTEYFSQENTMKRYREQMRGAGYKA